MFPLRSVKRLFGSLLTPHKTNGTRRRSGRIRPMLEALEDRLAPATVSDGGTAALKIVLGANENLAIVSDGTSYTFTSNKNFTAASASNPANGTTAFSGFDTMNLTLTSAGLAQYATGVNISDAGANATVTFNDSGTNSYANNFTISLTNVAAGAITFNGKTDFGAFNLQATTTHNLIVNSGAVLESSTGNLTLTANEQTTPTSGTFAGVTINGGTVESSASGLITIQGRGGASGTSSYGVYVENGGSIIGGTGTVTVTGTGGPVQSTGDDGVALASTSGSATITSTGGDVHVVGQGGGLATAAGGSNYGVSVGPGGSITAGGTGAIIVQGTGGADSTGSDYGVSVAGAGTGAALITSSGGDVQVIGVGGGAGGSKNYGVSVGTRGKITAGGLGGLTVQGTGGATNGGANYGVYSASGISSDSAVITSAGGNVRVIGQGGGLASSTNGNNYGVSISAGGQVTNGGAGGVTILGTGGVDSGGNDYGINLTGTNTVAADVNSGGGNVQITGQGGGAGSSKSNYGVYVGTGGHVNGGGGAQVTVQGSGGATHGKDDSGVVLDDMTSAALTAHDADLRIIGTGGGIGQVPGLGVNLNGRANALGGGNLVITGTGNFAVGTNGSLSTDSGDIQIVGNGDVALVGSVTAGGAGNITVTGTGATNGGGSFVDGVDVFASIVTNGGNVKITGTGGNDTLAAGVHFNDNGAVSAAGNGTVTITGMGGSAGAVVIMGKIDSVNGDLHVTGAGGGGGGGSGTAAVVVGGNAQLATSGTGSIFVSGTAGQDTVIPRSVNGVLIAGTVFSKGGAIQVTGVGFVDPGILIEGHIDQVALATGNNGNITLISDGIWVNPQVFPPGQIDAGTGTLTLVPKTPGTPIDITSAVFGWTPTLELSLNAITAGTIQIGDSSSGPITIRNPIALTVPANLSLTSGSDIIFNPGSINTLGGTLTLTPGSTGSVQPITSGTDADLTSVTLAFAPGANLAIALNGPTVGTQYNQLSVKGDINLTGVNLLLSGTLTPTVGETFTIVNNQGSHPIIGTFNGLPEGAVIRDFPATNFEAVISYVGGDGNDVVLTVKPGGTIVSDSGTGLLSVSLGAGANVGIVANAAGYTLTSNQVFIAAGSADPANQSSAFSGFGTTTLTITGTGAAQYATGISITDAGPRATVTFNDSGSNAYANNFSVALSNRAAGAIVFNGTSHFGAFNLSAATTRDILLDSGASVTSGSGNLTLAANQQANPTSGDFAGVTIDNATLQCSGSGLVTVQGTGGDTGSAEYGVWVENGGTITGGTMTGATGAAAVSGTGGRSDQNNLHGVYLTGTGSTITSAGGAVLIAGQGGGMGNSNNDYGVFVDSGATASAGGNGSITIRGTGGALSNNPNQGGRYNVGVFVTGTITSSGGDVEVTGQGGGGSSQGDSEEGVSIDGHGLVTAGGSGKVTVQGTGGATRSSNYGVGLADVPLPGVTSNVMVTSSGGDVTIIGKGGGSNASYDDVGILINAGAQVTAGGMGNVTVQGTGGTAGNLSIAGEVNSGVKVLGTVTSSGGNVQVTGQIGSAIMTGVPVGFSVIANAVEIAGPDGGAATGTVTAGGMGNVTVQGTASGPTMNGFCNGVYVDGNISSQGGNILITGQGGSGADASGSSDGVFIDQFGQVLPRGSGSVTVQGTAGANGGNFNRGVYLGGTISSNGGAVQLTGQGGNGTASSAGNYGVDLNFGGQVSAGGLGTVSVQGTGGSSAGGGNHGVYVQVNGTSLHHNRPTMISSQGGNVQVTGAAGLGTNSLAISVADTITTPAVGGNITLIGDSMQLAGGSVIAGSKTVALFPFTSGTPINLGSANSAGTLGLTNAEIGVITAGTLQIGSAQSGALTLSTPITLSTATNVNLVSGSDIVFDPGSINSDGGALNLAPGAAGSVQPITAGPDAVVAPAALGFAPGSNLAIAINGTTVDTQYNQLNVNGDVNLTGANLVLSGTLTPVLGQTFTIVNNQGTHPIVGTFNGLPEGGFIHNFLGSSLDAVITYVGGGGNDVVLTVVPPAPPLPKALVNSLNSLEGTSGLTPFVFQIRLASAARSSVTYDVYTTDGTAKAGVNYLGITAGDAAHGGTVTFAPGSAFATVTVYVIAGSLPVTPATVRADFTVHLSDPSAPGVSLASGTGIITAQVAVPRAAVPAAAHRRLKSEPWNRMVAVVVAKKLDDEWDK
jgi:hypothetical protein